ncbi:facilitated trehalose transporter Tret1-like isoform X2 [Bombyx mandarina]|uniref:Facilitated trehalose transporter Tret1-like isoform X2 n=1 Tax=Bombyx mandarina TaxID=7092 RepID=A0A6J2KRF0_BOMMA|nr:facilitated trehalose transporter Tret1-like isoform X2 [Bombyx mandarina]
MDHSVYETASLIGLSLCVGSIVCSLIMEIIGRKPAIIMSSVFTICGWISFSLASTFPVLLIGKIVQGISVGIGTTMGCILVAEYSSPKYRGSFIAAMPPAMLIGGLIAHSFGLFYGWHDLSTILIFFSLPGLIVAVLSPESPSYLVVKGRYDECRKVFRWLREKSEDDEVEAMIKTHMILKQSKKNQELNFFKLIKIKFIYVVTAVKKRECRIPIIIMMHLSAINQFCGSIVQEMYALDIHNALYGTDTYMFKVITSLDLQRIIATVSAIYITSKLKRRSMLLIFVALTVIANVCIAGYIYARHHDLVWLDHMAIGIFLHHFHTFVIGTGCLPLAFIIGGEIYPLADKGFCVTICNVLSAAYMFVNIKSAPYLFTLIGVDGAYCLNALILVYSLIVIMVMLPETKNRTLQEIEDEFRGFAVVGNHEDAFDLRCNEIEDNENL